jgi:hypothetical protein
MLLVLDVCESVHRDTTIKITNKMHYIVYRILLPKKMELIEGSETSAISNQTPGKYPKENLLHVKHGESLKSRRCTI